MEVLEGLDDRLTVRYQGEIVPSRRRRPVPACSEASSALPQTGRPNTAGSTVRAGDGRLPWQHSTLGPTPPTLASRSKTAVQP